MYHPVRNVPAGRAARLIDIPPHLSLNARMRVLASTQRREKVEVGSYHHGMINIQVLIHASWALPVTFAHTLQSVHTNSYVHTQTWARAELCEFFTHAALGSGSGN